MSSARLTQRGQRICAASVILAPLLLFAKEFGSAAHLYGAIIVAVAMVILTYGFVMAAYGYRKRDREIERGYTSWKTALDGDNALIGIDAYTLKAISSPEPPK